MLLFWLLFYQMRTTTLPVAGTATASSELRAPLPFADDNSDFLRISAVINSSVAPFLALRHYAQVHAHLLRCFPRPSALLPLFNSAIRALSKSALPSAPLAAARLFVLMARASVAPDRFTLPFVVNCAAALPSLPFGSQLHAFALRCGLLPSVLPVGNAIIDMYGKCGSLPLARVAFQDVPGKDVVSFNALLGAHARLGLEMREAQKVFDSMADRNVISWNAMIVGYANVCDLASARVMFDRMPVRNVVSWEVMIVGYCKIGSVDEARELFDKMPEKNLVSWTVMINGYSQCGRPQEALEIFREMERCGVEPDAPTMVGVISASAQMGSVELANWVGTYVDRKRIERNERVLTALVDMHSKCGNVEQAFRAFGEIPSPDAYSYTALISGLASHGHAMEALEIFDRMQKAAIWPDPITFVGVLSACSHAGLVDKGLEFWDSMVHDYQMERRADHYACVVDMLGRAGRLKEAHDIVNSMPMGPHPGALGALLASCRTYGNIEIAESVAKDLFKLEPNNPGNYVLLSSIYAEKGQWDDANRVRALIRGRRFNKLPGLSWVDKERKGHKLEAGMQHVHNANFG